MENATKALVMAGGILITILIIGALYLMFSNLAEYQNSKDDLNKASQIAEFNNQFEPYNKVNDKLTKIVEYLCWKGNSGPKYNSSYFILVFKCVVFPLLNLLSLNLFKRFHI